MRVLLYLALSVALFCALVLADHHKGDGKKDNQGKRRDEKDDHETKGGHHHHRHGHHHGHRRGHHHGHRRGHHHHRHHSNESLPCHRIAKSNAKFAFELFSQLARDHSSENIVFSPVSISMALAFLSLGAKGQTKQQILNGIGFNISEISEKDIHEGFHHLLDMLNDENEFLLESGNALFISQAWNILQDFLDNAKNTYQSDAISVDFQNNEEAKKLINSYVEEQTNGTIKDILSSVSKEAALILVNYIYFKGQWENPFDQELTREGDFRVDENTVVKVPFMSRTGYYNVGFLDEAEVVALPYKGNMSALFVLPKEGKLESVEANLQYIVKKWKRTQRMGLVDLSIPKFSISGSLDLKEVLSKFGIVDMFSDKADLSDITGAKDLKISQALHKAKLNVHEKGTEATGVTLLEAVPMMLPPHIKFNRPFCIIIYSHDSNSFPFMSKLHNPAN
ncbi:alpha-1-antitrypsin-like protein GS55-MS [Gastrophryne carolinensis]